MKKELELSHMFCSLFIYSTGKRAKLNIKRCKEKRRREKKPMTAWNSIRRNLLECVEYLLALSLSLIACTDLSMNKKKAHTYSAQTKRQLSNNH